MQIATFINQTSGVNTAEGVNSNAYYLNVFTSALVRSTGSFTTNSGGQAAAAVAALPRFSGGTVIAAGIEDLTAQFQALGGTANKLAIVLTDGNGGAVLDAADALRAEGVTVVAVGLGGGPSARTLEDIASTGSDGSELVFANSEFSEIAALAVRALEAIGAQCLPSKACYLRNAWSVQGFCATEKRACIYTGQWSSCIERIKISKPPPAREGCSSVCFLPAV